MALMSCPFCKSKKINGTQKVRFYDIRGATIAIDHIECGGCGAVYSMTVRENPSTGERRVIYGKVSGPAIETKGRLRNKLRSVLHR